MASSGIRTPRSVSDATRFTPTTPHAASKGTPSSAASSASPSAAAAPSRFATGSRLPGRRPPPGAGPSSSGGAMSETPEQRVARLRAAHLAAKNAQVSSLDRLVDKARGFFDQAHKLTTMGLIGLSAVATVVTIYAAVDMMTYNRKRKAEFIEAQRRMHADSLEAARLAYMRGDATPDQIELVEDANARGEGASIFSKMPSVIGAPQPLGGSEAAAATAARSGGGVGGAPKEEEENGTQKAAAAAGWGAGIWGFFGGSLKAEDDAAAAVSRAGGIVSSVEDKARAAFDKERENQKKGGLLDQVGNEVKDSSSEKPKKGWW